MPSPRAFIRRPPVPLRQLPAIVPAATIASPTPSAEAESARALTRLTLTAVSRLEDQLAKVPDVVGRQIAEHLARREAQPQAAAADKVAEEAAAATDGGSTPPPQGIDLVSLGTQFLGEVTTGIKDRAKRSTYKSAFDYWWPFWEKEGGSGYPDDDAINRFGSHIASAQSPDYGVSRMRVLRKWREWLVRRGIATAPPAPPKPPKANKPPGGPAVEPSNLTTEMAAAVEAIADRLKDKVFDSDQAQDHWAVVTRRVAAALGPRGIAAICGIHVSQAERWVQLKKFPRNYREALEHAYMLILVKKAMVKFGKDFDELWEDLIKVESMFIGSGPGFDEV